jgi:hypothetical protein
MLIVRSLSLFAALSFCISALAQEPARRPHAGGFSASPARAVCKDETYMCMYNCVVVEGQVCTPTRGSDANCPSRKITNGHWISEKLVVLDFEGYHDMGCNVVARAKTNVNCGMTKYGWECWPGKVHNR